MIELPPCSTFCPCDLFASFGCIHFKILGKNLVCLQEGSAAEPAAPAAATTNTTTSAATSATDAAKTTATKAETTLKGQAATAVTLTEAQLKQVQKTLKVKETGKLDPETTAAIVKFQKENKLTNTTGAIDTATAAKLGVKL